MARIRVSLAGGGGGEPGVEAAAYSDRIGCHGGEGVSRRWAVLALMLLLVGLVPGVVAGSEEAVTCFGLPATVVGSDGPEVLTGTEGSDVIVGLGGDDTITGLGGGDRICSGGGNDVIDGGLGNDRVLGGDGDDTIEGGGRRDVLKGEGGNDRIVGGSGDDTVSGGPGDDVLIGGPGADELVGGAGRDTLRADENDAALDGGLGRDVANFAGAGVAVSVDLALGGGTPRDGRSGGFTVVGVEGLVGSGFDDQLVGDAGANQIDGGGGSDSLFGGAGVDTLSGGVGDDAIHGGDIGDTVLGQAGDDALWGDGANDSLSGGAGDDQLDGGTGTDTLDGGTGINGCIYEAGALACSYDASHLVRAPVVTSFRRVSPAVVQQGGWVEFEFTVHDGATPIGWGFPIERLRTDPLHFPDWRWSTPRGGLWDMSQKPVEWLDAADPGSPESFADRAQERTSPARSYKEHFPNFDLERDFAAGLDDSRPYRFRIRIPLGAVPGDYFFSVLWTVDWSDATGESKCGHYPIGREGTVSFQTADCVASAPIQPAGSGADFTVISRVDPVPIGPDAAVLFDNATTPDDQGHFRLRFSLKNQSEWHSLTNPVVQISGPGLESIWCGDLACGGMAWADADFLRQISVDNFFVNAHCGAGTCSLPTPFSGGDQGQMAHLGDLDFWSGPVNFSSTLWFDIGFTLDPATYNPSNQYTITVTADGFDVNPANNTVTFTIPGT